MNIAQVSKHLNVGRNNQRLSASLIWSVLDVFLRHMATLPRDKYDHFFDHYYRHHHRMLPGAVRDR